MELVEVELIFNYFVFWINLLIIFSINRLIDWFAKIAAIVRNAVTITHSEQNNAKTNSVL